MELKIYKTFFFFLGTRLYRDPKTLRNEKKPPASCNDNGTIHHEIETKKGVLSSSLFSPLPLSHVGGPLFSPLSYFRGLDSRKKNLPSRSCTSVVRGGADKTTSRWFVPPVANGKSPIVSKEGRADRPFLCKSWKYLQSFLPLPSAMLLLLPVLLLASSLSLASAQLGGGGGGSCICPAVFQPVCGRDGRTHGNSCQARCGGGEVKETKKKSQLLLYTFASATPASLLLLHIVQ